MNQPKEEPIQIQTERNEATDKGTKPNSDRERIKAPSKEIPLALQFLIEDTKKQWKEEPNQIQREMKRGTKPNPDRENESTKHEPNKRPTEREIKPNPNTDNEWTERGPQQKENELTDRGIQQKENESTNRGTQQKENESIYSRTQSNPDKERIKARGKVILLERRTSDQNYEKMTRLTKSESKLTAATQSDIDVSHDMKSPATNRYEINEDPGMILDRKPVAVASE